VIQFVKSDRESGEFAALQKMAGVEIAVTGLGFVPRPTHPRFADHCRAAEEGLRIAAEAASSGRYGLVVLDEACTAVALKLLSEEAVLQLLHGAAPECTIVLTGRGATEGLIRAADTVTEMRCIKHGFDNGLKAQKGVEF
jgi:cob(I)alamin adenosyltransferase